MKELDKLKKKIVLLSKDNNHVMDRIERDLSYLSEEWISLINESLNKIVVLRPDGSGSPARHVRNSHYHPLYKCIFILDDMELGKLIHEIGHVIEYRLKKENNQVYKNLVHDLVKDKTLYDIIQSENYGGLTIITDPRLVSEYQGHVWDKIKYFSDGKISINAVADYFAEGFKFYFIDPVCLEERDYPLYNFIKELV